MFGAPLPTLSDPLTSLTVLAPTIGSAGLTDAPSGGASAASGSYSAALFGLNGNAAATSCVPAAFSATMSPSPEASGSAGPLTVVRLLRTVLLFFVVFDGRDDLGMYDVTLAEGNAAGRVKSMLRTAAHEAHHMCSGKALRAFLTNRLANVGRSRVLPPREMTAVLQLLQIVKPRAVSLAGPMMACAEIRPGRRPT